MKSSQEIANSISQQITSIYIRPSVHVGGGDRAEDSLVLYYVLWHLHYQWANAHGRVAEFRSILDSVHTEAKCGPLDFARTFRRRNTSATNQECFQFVQQNWQTVSRRLGIPLIDELGKTVNDATSGNPT